MDQIAHAGDRRTSVDEIFDYLYEEIVSLRLLPGDKISEADIAARFGVSRQPVRDAFSRLANLDLILVRPQRATEVRRFSMRDVVKSRFVRAAVEREVLRRAAEFCDVDGARRLAAELADQERVIETGDVDGFGELDYRFHEALCDIARADYAFDVIQTEKSKVDRLCVLGLAKESRLPDLLADHRDIAEAVESHDADRAIAAGMLHLSRLDETISRISETNANYFEPFEA